MIPDSDSDNHQRFNHQNDMVDILESNLSTGIVWLHELEAENQILTK